MKYFDFQKHPLVVTITLLAIGILLSGCANMKGAINGFANPDKVVEQPPSIMSEQPLNAHDAKAAQYQALQKVGESATDAETKRMAIFALAMLNNGGNQPQMQTVIQNRGPWEVAFGFLDRTLERAISVAPAYLGYKSNMRANETTERVAGINRDVSIAQSNNFLGLGVAGINGTQNTAIAGFNALGNAANAPRTSVTVTGNTGSTNIGSGTQTNSSNNPVTNPSKVCATSATGVVTCN